MEADISVFVSIRRVDPRGVECWSSREFAEALGYTDFRNFAAVIAKVKLACLNSGQTVEDPFVDITEMVEIGSGAKVRQTIQELGGTDVYKRQAFALRYAKISSGRPTSCQAPIEANFMT